MLRISDTKIDHTQKGFGASVTWTDGVRANSMHFDTYKEADDWLTEFIQGAEPNREFPLPHRSRAVPIKPFAAALMAISLIIPSLPALADEPLKDPGGRGSGRVSQQFTPTNNGGPVHSGSTGTR